MVRTDLTPKGFCLLSHDGILSRVGQKGTEKAEHNKTWLDSKQTNSFANSSCAAPYQHLASQGLLPHYWDGSTGGHDLLLQLSSNTQTTSQRRGWIGTPKEELLSTLTRNRVSSLLFTRKYSCRTCCRHLRHLQQGESYGELGGDKNKNHVFREIAC